MRMRMAVVLGRWQWWRWKTMRWTRHSHHGRRGATMMRIVMGRRRIPSAWSACTWRRRAVRHVFFRRSRIREGMIILPAAPVHHVRCMLHFFGAWGRRAVVMHHHVVMVMTAWIIWIWFAYSGRISSPLNTTTTQRRHFGSHRRRKRRCPHDMRWTTTAVWRKVLLLLIHVVVGILLLLSTIAGVSWHHDVDVGMMMLLHGNATKRHRGQRSRWIRRRAPLVVIIPPLTHLDGLERQWRRKFAVPGSKIGHGSVL